MDVVGVSKARTTGSYVTKSGKKAYRGQRKHWYVYFYDDEGRFRKKTISALEVPYYGSLIRRTKTYTCDSCGTKFRAIRPACPKCGGAGSRPVGMRRRGITHTVQVKTGRAELSSEAWVYEGTFIVETDESHPTTEAGL